MPADQDGASIARDALAKAREAAALKRRAYESSAAARTRAETRRANLEPRTRAGEGDGPQSFGDAISQLLGDRGWEAEITVASVLTNWEQTVGPELAAHCVPRSLEAGVLTIEAESTAWATQIRLLQQQLLERVTVVAGEGVVRRLVVQGPTGPSWQHGRLRVRGRGPRDTYG